MHHPRLISNPVLTSMLKAFVVVLLLLGLVLGGIFGWKVYQGMQMAEQAGQGQPPAMVAAAEARRERWEPSLDTVGSLVAMQGVEVTNEVPGQVSAIHFESGSEVAAGELLVELDATVDRANLEGLIAERELARVEFRRIEELLEDNSISRSDYDEAQARLDNAQAAVAAQQAAVAKKLIRAPFAGQLGIRRVDLGQYLAPGSPIVGLRNLDSIYVDYTLPERHLARLEEGQPVTVQVQAYPEQVFEGRLTAIEPGIDPGTRSIELRGTLENPDHLLRPGMFAQVRTHLPADEAVLTVPRTAITYNPYGDIVFVLREDEDGQLVAQRRQVETGEVREGRVAIRAGLAPGDRVVSAGQQKLRNGQPVEVDESVDLAGPRDARVLDVAAGREARP